MEYTEYKEYISKIGNIRIEYKLNDIDCIAHMDFVNYNPEYIKMFLLTLKTSIEDLKKCGIKKIIQKVSNNDWNEYLKKEEKWTLKEINEDLEYCIIECDIDNIFYCIAKGLGIYEGHTDYKTIIE